MEIWKKTNNSDADWDGEESCAFDASHWPRVKYQKRKILYNFALFLLCTLYTLRFCRNIVWIDNAEYIHVHCTPSKYETVFSFCYSLRIDFQCRPCDTERAFPGSVHAFHATQFFRWPSYAYILHDSTFYVFERKSYWWCAVAHRVPTAYLPTRCETHVDTFWAQCTHHQSHVLR